MFASTIILYECHQSICNSTGVTIFVRAALLSKDIFTWNIQVINDDSFQIIMIKLETYSIMGVYRSPSFASEGTKY